jgi:hypothetical protein
MGPGKYDGVCSLAREATEGKAVVLIVLDGNRGSGFSVQAESLGITSSLSALLRVTADVIERSLVDEIQGKTN